MVCGKVSSEASRRVILAMLDEGLKCIYTIAFSPSHPQRGAALTVWEDRRTKTLFWR
jgi:hypothetical protein